MTFKKVLRYISLSEYSHPNFLTFHRIWCPAGPLGGDFHTHFMNVLYRKAAQLDFIQILLTLLNSPPKRCQKWTCCPRRAQNHVKNGDLGVLQPKKREKWTSWPPRAQNHVGNRNFSRFATKTSRKWTHWPLHSHYHVKNGHFVRFTHKIMSKRTY